MVAPILATASPALAQPLTEQQAIERALGDADTRRRDVAERQAARAAVEAIPLLENPEVAASRSRLKGATDEEEREFGIVQPLDLSGRRAALRAAARAEAGAVDADVERRRQELVADVRRAYASCTAAAETAQIKIRFAAHLRDAERVTGERTAAGDTAGYDLRRLRVESRSADAQARLAEGERAAQCATLAALTATPDVQPSTRLGELARAGVAVPSTGRADLVALERRASAAQATARAAQRARLPEVRVGIAQRELEVLGAKADGPVVSLSATVPIFGVGAQAREARARAQARTAELALSRRRADAEAAAARARLEAAQQALAAGRATQEDAARLGTIAATAYQAGEVGVTELVDAYRSAHDAEVSIVELTERTIKAAIDLDLAQGGAIP
jgi:cobalt-zinc-cadmium efflux system outer membrane protein